MSIPVIAVKVALKREGSRWSASVASPHTLPHRKTISRASSSGEALRRLVWKLNNTLQANVYPLIVESP